MGLIESVRSLFGEEDEEPAFRCIRCGADLDKEYHSCPECGGQFIAPVEEDAPPASR